jgi:hypothetical protein
MTDFVDPVPLPGPVSGGARRCAFLCTRIFAVLSAAVSPAKIAQPRNGPLSAAKPMFAAGGEGPVNSRHGQPAADFFGVPKAYRLAHSMNPAVPKRVLIPVRSAVGSNQCHRADTADDFVCPSRTARNRL